MLIKLLDFTKAPPVFVRSIPINVTDLESRKCCHKRTYNNCYWAHGSFPKDKICLKLATPVAVGNSFIWLMRTFRNHFMTTKFA